MLMLWVTKVFHPGPPRIGRITKNVVLPRSVPLPVLVASAVGGAFGLVAGIVAGSLLQMPVLTTALLGMVGGGFACILLVTAQPWQGEHVHRVAAVRAAAFASTKSLVCPGSGLPSVYADDVGTLVCSECGRAHSSSELITPQHHWRRRAYVGVMPIPHPVLGDVEIVSGSVPARGR